MDWDFYQSEKSFADQQKICLTLRRLRNTALEYRAFWMTLKLGNFLSFKLNYLC